MSLIVAIAGLGAWGLSVSPVSIQPVLERLSGGLQSLPLPVALLAVALFIVILLWRLPQWQVARSRGLTAENQFDRENEARKTLAQILGGVFFLAGLYSSVQHLTIAREGQITDRFTKSIEQLGAVDRSGKPNLEDRLGAIYALERIARDSEKDHWPIMEVLTAYVRENSPRQNDDPQTGPQAASPRRHLPADIQAVVTVIGRREFKHDPAMHQIDLTNTDLQGASAEDAYLRRANFSGANLRRAKFGGANLSEADLGGADLTGANLIDTNLSGAFLSEAMLSGANLSGAFLSGGYFLRADLKGALLTEADLSKSDLGGADFGAANLLRADLSGSDLSATLHFTRYQLDQAIKDKDTRLPVALK